LKEKQILSRKFLFVSRWGESLDIVNSIKAEGNEVKFYIEDKPSKEIGYGFVDKVTHWEKFIDWADIVIFDYTGYGKIATELRRAGKLVIGGTEYTDRLELDRNFGQSELQKHKIKVIPSKEFTSFHDAIKYIENNPNTYVIKPCGETQELKQLLFVGSDDEGLDVIRVLKAYEKSWGNDFGNFQLQRKVKGVEISIAAYFNGKEFIYPINITFEHKKLFPKELGVSTGEMGTSMFWTKDSPIFDATLLKFQPCGETQELKQLLFVGSDDEGLDVIRVLKAYEKSWGDDFGNFQLQRKVKGVEISIAAFFNGKEFIYPINITFEHKKLFPKELGVSTGEMGTSMFWTKDSPIFDATLLKFQSTLAKDNFVGHIDINCIVNGNGIYPLEFTSRFGYPQIFIQRSGINEPMGEFFIKIASKQNFKINVKKGFQVGAFIVVPPFPYDDKKTFNLFSKDAVVVFKKNGREGVHPMHLKKVNDEWLITGNTGIAVLVTGNGQTMKDAQKMMYNRISNVIINNGYYRTDIGDRWSEDSDKLWSWGLL